MIISEKAIPADGPGAKQQVDYGPPAFSFTVPALRGARFEGRPLTVSPAEKTIGFLYARQGDALRQIGPAVFKDGEWKRLSKAKAPEPTHWVVMVSA